MYKPKMSMRIMGVVEYDMYEPKRIMRMTGVVDYLYL